MLTELITRSCPHCEKSYEASPQRMAHGRQLFCSRQCALTARALEKTDKYVIGACFLCGIEIKRSASEAAVKYGMFCGKGCLYEARRTGKIPHIVVKPYAITEEGRKAQAENMQRTCQKRKAEGRYGHTEATKRRLSEAQAEAMSAGRVHRVSKLEIEVGKRLRDLGYKVEAQFLVRGDGGRYLACCDFYLPDLNLAVEVNGTYWHADPRVYPEGPVSPSQKRTCEKYAVKMKALKVLGIEVREVWEKDFRADPDKAVRTALSSL